MMDERVSVIVPVHNGQEYLAACVESIAGQTYSDLEIIIVNDGSTDGTQAVCEELAGRYHNVKIITLPDLGVSAARNHALEQTTGNYVMFVDADDRLKRDTVERLYKVLIEKECDVAGCGFGIWHTEEELSRLMEDKPEEVERNLTIMEYDGYRFLAEGILNGNSRCWSKLYRRETIGDIRFRKDFTIGEDMLFLVDIQPNVRKAAEISYPGYCYYQNPNGAMQRPFTIDYMDQITCWETAREQILKLDHGLRNRVTSQILISIMLTVGKIAVLPPEKRREFKECLRLCRRKIKKELKVKGAYKRLPPGYRIKTRFFAWLPKLYVFLYYAGKKCLSCG